MTLRKDLIRHSLLKNVITDTHYNNPDRKGRHVTFMARISQGKKSFDNFHIFIFKYFNSFCDKKKITIKQLVNWFLA